jgi:predicted ferric reductase
MKNIKLSFLFVFATLTALWVLADGPFAWPYQFLALRDSLINYTGIVAIGAMSVGMMLATRPARVEPFLGGLDKTYRLHKWLGVSALVLSVVHWLWAQSAKWMVGWGWLTRPEHHRPAAQSVALLDWFQSHRQVAEQLGEWAFYAAVVLVVLALWKRFPYRHFFNTHRLLAVVYLVLVFHSLVLMKFTYWGAAIGPLMVVLMAGGSAAAVVSLLGRVGYRRRAVGVISELVHHADNRVLKVTVALKDRWPGHEAGQFAFVTFERGEGPHPYTISSAWNGDGSVSFLIKGIGDYTDTLPASLKVGALVKIEGPYGRFDFAGSQPRQIWVAGGIGITPFVARMRALEHAPDGKGIDLFYSTSAPDEGFIDKVRLLAEKVHVHLHLIVAGNSGRLNAERICQSVPDWKSANVWFCGPARFGTALQRDLGALGLPARSFQQELFDMR